jgi:hypothetical protein
MGDTASLLNFFIFVRQLFVERVFVAIKLLLKVRHPDVDVLLVIEEFFILFFEFFNFALELLYLQGSNLLKLMQKSYCRPSFFQRADPLVQYYDLFIPNTDFFL